MTTVRRVAAWVYLAALLMVVAMPAWAVGEFSLSVSNGSLVGGRYQVTVNSELAIEVRKTGDWESADVVWASSNDSVAGVEFGVVFARARGTATITATATSRTTGQSASQSIAVEVIAGSSTQSPTTVTLRSTGGVKELAKGETLELIADVTPEGVGVTWSSSNVAVATVGQKGKVTAIKAGKVTIKATANDGSGASASIALTVTSVAESVTLSKQKMTLYVGGVTKKLRGTAKLQYSIKPSSATSASVTWTSSNPDVAKVGAKGQVTALKAGTTTIQITVNGLKDSCKVTVEKLPTKVQLPVGKVVAAGKTVDLGDLVKVDGTLTKLRWRSANTRIAKVTQKGVVRGMRPGQTKVGVMTVNGRTDTCIIKVTKK